LIKVHARIYGRRCTYVNRAESAYVCKQPDIRCGFPRRWRAVSGRLRAGQTYGSGRLRVDEERIKSFAAEFDPQPFPLNAEAARKSILGGLAASGWHTAALTMRLLVESDLKPAGGIVGVGFDELRWPRPVRPGDELRLESEILDVRPSKSRPQQGPIKVRMTALNQNGEAVQVLVANLMVPRRSSNMAKRSSVKAR
jgi:acyl dehydratase